MHISDKDHVWTQRREQFSALPESILFDLARNESAEYRMRKFAVTLMLEKGYKKAHHPEIFPILAAVQNDSKERAEDQKAKREVEEILETALEESIEDIGPHKASFTTATMYGLPLKEAFRIPYDTEQLSLFNDEIDKGTGGDEF
jgi:hypothetical protein